MSTSPPAGAEPAQTTSVGKSAASGGTFAVANAAQRALVFVMLPVYTAVLGPEAYGRLGLLITIQSGAIVVLQIGMEASVTRHYFGLAGDAAAQRRFISSAWRFLAIGAPAVAALGAALFGLSGSSGLIRADETSAALLSAGTFVAATAVPLVLLRAQQRLRDFVIFTAVTGLTTTAVTALLVVVLDWGVMGWFVAALVSNVVIFLTGAKLVPWERPDRFDKEGVRTAVKLGLTLLPHAVSLWALSLADRVFLADMVSATDLGVYTLAANLAIPAMVVIQSANQGFLPAYARAQDPAERGPLRQIASIQVLLIVAVTVSVVVVAPLVVGLLDPVYARAEGIVPWLVLGAFFWGLYQLPMNVIAMITGRTKYVWVVSAIAAAVSLGSLVGLVSAYGLSAAGPASAVGYLALLLCTVVYLRVLGEAVDVDRKLIGSVLAIGALTVLAADSIPTTGASGFFGRALLVVLSVGLLLFAGGLRWRHLEALSGGKSETP